MIYSLLLIMLKHGRTRSIAACSKPRFAQNQAMSNCPADGAVCPPPPKKKKITEIIENNAFFSF